jgi:two-component system, NarL family, sensor histidine kinase UhpB
MWDDTMTTLTHCHADVAPEKKRFPWMDAAVVVGATLAAAVTFARLEMTEALFDFTRTWEHLQLDELPGTLLVLAAALAWFAWRRYTEARRELARRESAEAKLASLLEDQRRLAQQHVQYQESERKALARELHDELGQYLNAIKTDAVTIQTKGATDVESLKRSAAAIVSHCDHLQDVLRSLIGQLRPVGLDVLGLRAALEHFLDRIQQRTPERKISIHLEGDLDDLDENVSLTVYRIIQEGLTNVSRHSGARHVELKVVRSAERRSESDLVELSLVDDGRGMNPASKTAGLGLIGMRERVEMLAGELRVITAPSSGFSVFARIPAKQPTTRLSPALTC